MKHLKANYQIDKMELEFIPEEYLVKDVIKKLIGEIPFSDLKEIFKVKKIERGDQVRFTAEIKY